MHNVDRSGSILIAISELRTGEKDVSSLRMRAHNRPRCWELGRHSTCGLHTGIMNIRVDLTSIARVVRTAGLEAVDYDLAGAAVFTGERTRGQHV